MTKRTPRRAVSRSTTNALQRELRWLAKQILKVADRMQIAQRR